MPTKSKENLKPLPFNFSSHDISENDLRYPWLLYLRIKKWRLILTKCPETGERAKGYYSLTGAIINSLENF